MVVMNYVLVGLTFLILAWVLISCAVLGADRLAGAEHVSRDGIDAPGPARAPYEDGPGMKRTPRDDDGRPRGRG